MRLVSKPFSVLLLLCVLLAGCDASVDAPPEEVAFDAWVMLGILHDDAPPAYLLHREDTDETYFPVNLPTEFHEEGLEVHVEGLLIHDYTVLLMPPIEITNIRRLED